MEMVRVYLENDYNLFGKINNKKVSGGDLKIRFFDD